MAQYGSEVLAIELANLLDAAHPLPLVRDRVRVDRREIDHRVRRLTKAVEVEVAGFGLDTTVASDLTRAAAGVRDAISDANPIPLTDQVRLPRARAAAAAAALRTAAAL
jgi:hypothetical protein